MMLYPRAMGASFAQLPKPLQVFHSVSDTVFYKGEVSVSHGSAVARGLARAGGMPATSGTMPFEFRATRDGDQEVWERNFNGHFTRSRQWLHRPGVVAEKVGGSTFLMEPAVQGDTLSIPISGVTGFGIPLPSGIMKSCAGVEAVAPDGAITFDVHATLRGLGLLIRYQGRLYPA